MCGIIGVFNNAKAEEQVKIALAALKNRGKDASNILNINENGALGHNLHAIISNIPQPLKGKGILTANCEIYNWQELNKKYQFNVQNDAEVLLKLLDNFGLEKLKELDGVYAFAYLNNNQLFLVRDILGEKPLWYSQENGFSFASEKKTLIRIGCQNVQELNPRNILTYDLKEKKINFTYRNFFAYLPENEQKWEKIKKQTQQLLHLAIDKRIPAKKFGLLFSGGVDSTYLANYLTKKRYDFTCYTTVLESETEPQDLIYAKKAAKELGLKLRIKTIKLSEIPYYLQKIVPLIEDSNVTKVGVALTFYLACEMAREDGCKVIFSGLGSEEIFAGYERHKHSTNINQECLSGLLKLYERDLYRDDVITMDNQLELRLPFLDSVLASYSLTIPGKYKISNEATKLILRDIAFEEGISKELAYRKKAAAQYGSRMNNALSRLSKIENYNSISAYLSSFYPKSNLKLGVLFSSGKDSTYSALIMQRQNYELSCLITLKSSNPDSFMFHTPAIDMVKLQAEAMGIPILLQETKGNKEEELDDLRLALEKAKIEHKIEGIITGAVFSTYQRDRIEKICDELGLKIFSPLWHKDQCQLLNELLINNFEVIFTSIAAEGLDESWLNRKITAKEVGELQKLSQKLGLNVAGEGGETESLVLDCDLFTKKIQITKSRKSVEKKHTGRLIIEEAGLIEK